MRRNCEYGIRHGANPSLAHALRSHLLHLRRMGELGVPVEIEIGSLPRTLTRRRSPEQPRVLPGPNAGAHGGVAKRPVVASEASSLIAAKGAVMFDSTILHKTFTATVAALALLTIAAPAGARTAEVGFGDPAGDANGAPDIQSVTVSDDASGKLVFRIQTDSPTRPPDAALFVDVNADRKQSTGGYNDGIDYVFGVSASGFGFARVTPSGALAVDAPGARATWQGGVATFTVNRRDLGGTNGFTFFVASALASSPGTIRDDAPNTGLWSYTPSSAVAVELTASKVFTMPISTRLYSAAMVVQRSDTGRFLGKEGRLRCSARIGTSVLATKLAAFVPTMVEGTKMTPGMCAWTLPAGSAGKTIRGTITATYGGSTVSRSFSAKVG